MNYATIKYCDIANGEGAVSYTHLTRRQVCPARGSLKGVAHRERRFLRYSTSFLTVLCIFLSLIHISVLERRAKRKNK